MEGRAGHIQSVLAAEEGIQRLRNSIMMAYDNYDEALSLVTHAVGNDPVPGFAEEAMTATVVISLKITELLDLTALAKERLTQYGGTF